MKLHLLRWVSTCAMLALLLAGSGQTLGISATAPDGDVSPKWSYNNLPAKACPGTTDTNCHYSSPVLADLTGDGRPEIITATNNGHVVAIRNTTAGGSERPRPALGCGRRPLLRHGRGHAGDRVLPRGR